MCKRDLSLILTTSLAIRFAAALYWHGDVSGIDVGRYLNQAQSIAETHSFTYNGYTTAMNGPLFPFILSFFFAAGFHSFLAQLLFVLIGSGTAILTYLLTERIQPRIALAAGLCMALAPMSVKYSVVLLTETLFTFLVTAALVLWSRGKWKLSGLAWGLSMLTRPTSLFFVLLLFLFGLKQRRHLIMASIAFLTVLPWTVRNAVQFHSFIPVASQGGGILLLGTVNLNYREPIWTQIDHTVLFLPEDLEGKPESVQDRILFWKAIDIIRAHPLEWLKARAKQYPLFFADTGQYFHHISKRGVEGVFLTGNALFLLLSLIGLYILRDHFWRLAFLTLWPTYFALIHLPMWVEARYSLPIVPEMIILSTISVCSMLVPKNSNVNLDQSTGADYSSNNDRRGNFQRDYSRVSARVWQR